MRHAPSNPILPPEPLPQVTPRTPPAARRKQRACLLARPAFTLTELLIVIAIMALLASMIIPMMNPFMRFVSGGSTANTINAAVAAARAYATNGPADLQPLIDRATFSGAAILFTPSNELRLVWNDQTGTAANYDMLETPVSASASDGRNAYVDIPGRDYINLPGDAGVVGIARTAAGLILLAPPFAVRFNEHGQLVVGDIDRGNTSAYPTQGDWGYNEYNWVLYDGIYDGTYNIDGLYGTGTDADGEGRRNPYGSQVHTGTAYDPDSWDPRAAGFVSSNYDSTNKKYKLPFESIETVAAVLVFPRSRLDEAGYNLAAKSGTSAAARAGDINDNAKNWLLELDAAGKLKNAQAIFFSRYSGTMLKQ